MALQEETAGMLADTCKSSLGTYVVDAPWNVSNHKVKLGVRYVHRFGLETCDAADQKVAPSGGHWVAICFSLPLSPLSRFFSLSLSLS